MNNKFSLIMPTFNRKDEVKILLESLEKQSYKNFELIVVDQNDDDYIYNLCKKFSDKFEIKYIKSLVKGLSVNRNKGIKLVTGNIIAFPDDDCEYDVNTLKEVNDFFIKTNYNFFVCKVIDKISRKPFGKSGNKDCNISYYNVMKNCVSISIFIKYKNIEDISFDEKLGVGTYFASGEESDLVFSLLHKKYKGRYFSSIYIFHPFKQSYLNINRAKGDSLGLGALMKKEILFRKNIRLIPFYLSRLIRPLFGMILKPKYMQLYKYSVYYRLSGFNKYK